MLSPLLHSCEIGLAARVGDDVSPTTASDGRPARETGPWAEEKLTKLERYSEIVTTAMKKKFTGGLVFVDLMAGPGLCVDTRSVGRPEFRGSTLRALDTRFPFTRVLAIESDSLCVQALRERVGMLERRQRCTVLETDCNAEAAVSAVREVSRGALALMFVDLLGTEVRMETLRAMTADRQMDLVVTWPEMDAVRNRGQMLEQEKRWTAFFGTTDWIPLVTTLGPARRLRALQRLYADQLRLQGYGYTKYVGSVKNNRGHALYRPLFASKHARGLDLWEKATSTGGEQQHLAGF